MGLIFKKWGGFRPPHKMKGGLSMKKIKLEDIGLEEIWEIGDVANIPHGARRVVYYDTKNEILSSYLILGGESISCDDYTIIWEVFESVDSWYSKIPQTYIELGVEIDEFGEPERDQLLRAYKVIWSENYVVPEINEGGKEND
jgi:hypothetical protein